MRTRWKLAAALVCLALLLIVAYLLRITPVPTFGVKIGLVSATSFDAPDPLNPIALWIGRFFWAAVALAILGVLAWVTWYVLRRPREPRA